MYIKYEQNLERTVWTLIDSEFIAVIPGTHPDMTWGPFALQVARLYKEKNKLVAKNIARLLPRFLKRDTVKIHLNYFKGTDCEKYIDCILRQVGDV